MLPEGVVEALKRHLQRRKLEHEEDGGGSVYLPYALERKYKGRAGRGCGSMSSPRGRCLKTRVRAQCAAIILMR